MWISMTWCWGDVAVYDEVTWVPAVFIVWIVECPVVEFRLPRGSVNGKVSSRLEGEGVETFCEVCDT